MLDFLSSAYLGLHHSSASLDGWDAMTTARPAALGGAKLADMAALAVADLQGRQTAISGPSTLHLGVDLFTGGLPHCAAVYWDEHLYPVLQQAVRLAQASRRLPAHDAAALSACLKGSACRRRPVMVTDGYCLECGRPAPLSDYLTALAPHDGLLVVDDTQALGVFGRPGTPPFGDDGGGTLMAQRIAGEAPVMIVASLAKAFGAPIAVLSGRRDLVQPLARTAFSRQHCSPASIPNAQAALRAVRVNHKLGRVLRRRLAQRIELFCRLCMQAGVPLAPACHPVQSVRLGGGSEPLRLAAQAHRAGLAVAACRTPDGQPLLRLVVTAGHSVREIEEAAAILGSLGLGPSCRPRHLLH